jgi:hypothetical protein
MVLSSATSVKLQDVDFRAIPEALFSIYIRQSSNDETNCDISSIRASTSYAIKLLVR